MTNYTWTVPNDKKMVIRFKFEQEIFDTIHRGSLIDTINLLGRKVRAKVYYRRRRDNTVFALEVKE